MDNSALDNLIKKTIINKLNLENISSEDIETSAPLFGDGLGLDSIDALELGLGIKEQFKIKIDADENINKHFYSVESIRNYILNKNMES